MQNCVLPLPIDLETNLRPGIQLQHGDSIASEGKGEYMYCEGRVLDVEGKPIANCTIETWETDDEGLYDTQYSGRDKPDCRGRLKTDENGYYAVRCGTMTCCSG